MEFRLASSKFGVHRWGGGYTYIYYIITQLALRVKSLFCNALIHRVYCKIISEKRKKFAKKFVKWEIMSIFAAANERYNISDAL